MKGIYSPLFILFIPFILAKLFFKKR